MDQMFSKLTDVEPEIDYLSRDFNSIRQLMLDHLSVLVPNWTEESPADLGNMLVEVLAYSADYLSYYQDAVATEAYLGTSRLRRSVRRHTRLLDYFLHEGCNARAWVHIEVKALDKATSSNESTNQHVTLPKGTLLLTGPEDSTIGMSKIRHSDDTAIAKATAQQAQFFRTMHTSKLYHLHNSMDFHVALGDEPVLRQGATSACLEYRAKCVYLGEGDVLIFEEVRDPRTDLVENADPSHRHAVRLISVKRPMGTFLEISWSAADALPFDLYMTQPGRTTRQYAVARGNVVLADHGRWLSTDEKLPAVPVVGRYRPGLRQRGITHSEQYQHQVAETKSATETVYQNVRQALPALHVFQNKSATVRFNPQSLHAMRYCVEPADAPQAHHPRLIQAQPNNNDEQSQPMREEWTLRRDLLNSGPYDLHYMVEMEENQEAFLRFGFGGMGRQPASKDAFEVCYRIGNGGEGNVGRDTITRIIANTSDLANIVAVRNPLPAQGGVDPERAEEGRLHAPYAFRRQERCITEEDYAEVAARFPEVSQAIARIRSIGLWRTAFIYVQRAEGRALDSIFREEMAKYFEAYRHTGYSVEIRRPNFIPLDIGLKIVAEQDTRIDTLKKALESTFSAEYRDDGEAGFFHPGNFRFGEPLYRSPLIAEAMKIPGVIKASVSQFRLYNEPQAKNPQETLSHVNAIDVGPLEIIQVRNCADAPEMGQIQFDIQRDAIDGW